jgi:protein involved in polysaccharide export with SLBB domain
MTRSAVTLIPKSAAILTGCVLLVCGCATTKPHFAEVVMPPPAVEKAPLAPGDTINLTFTPEYDYFRPVSWSGRVDTQGNITGFFGQLHVAGLTREEAAQKIERVVSMNSREWGHGSISVRVSR